jgi:hypothetical protein
MQMPIKLLIAGPINIRGIFGDAFPRSPRITSAARVAERTGAAICTPSPNISPTVLRIEVVKRLLRCAVPGGT